MPENDLDPVASTQKFQAFVDRPEPPASQARTIHVSLAGAAVVGLLIVLALAWLELGG